MPRCYGETNMSMNVIMKLPGSFKIGLLFCLAALCCATPAANAAALRIGAAQPKSRLIDYRLTNAVEVLARIDQSLKELEQLIHKAGAEKCDALALPEDTLGLGTWEAANHSGLKAIFPEAVRRMLERLGSVAASHKMYLICSNDTVDEDGAVRNSALCLG